MPFDSQPLEIPPPLLGDDLTLRVLRGARELLAAGWCKGAMQSGDEYSGYKYCARGAIAAVNGRAFPFAYVESFVPKDRSLPDYNDDPKTTHADILALFDRAIATRVREIQ
jgi:hypothetical protein